MNYKPATQKQVNEARLVPSGDYDFEIVKAEPKASKEKQRPMLIVNHKIFVGESFRFINQMFMLDDDSFGKLRNLCECVGLLEKYEAGTLEPQDLVATAGKLKLKVGYDDFRGEDVNKVTRYIVPKVGDEAKPKTVKKKSPIADEDVPFPEDDDVPM